MTIKCLKRLHIRGIDDNLRQLVLKRQDCVLINLSNGFFTSGSGNFFVFSKNWVSRAMGNEALNWNALNKKKGKFSLETNLSIKFVYSLRNMLSIEGLPLRLYNAKKTGLPTDCSFHNFLSDISHNISLF